MKWGIYLQRAALLSVVLLAAGCVSGRQLTTESAVPNAVEGTYDLYLYGCRYASDIENAAILVASDAAYPLEIYAFETRYKVRKGLSAERALAEANAFVRCGMKKVWRSEMRRIQDDRGRTFAYDLRPLYMPYEIRAVDVLRMNYVLNNGTVTVHIDLAPGAEEDTFSPDERSRQGR